MNMGDSLFIKKLRTQLNRLEQKQKIILISSAAVAIFSLIMLMVWANRPEYTLLYAKLNAAETSKVVEDLKAKNIPYKIEDQGQAIFVRKSDVHELRIRYAGDQVISSGKIGYELFDKNNLGLTDFMQRINLKRALEGELANTINEIQAIEQTRIHLVIPEQRLFEEQQKPATASVVVRVKPNTTLGKKQINGIINLVAASVEGLEPESVTIVDTHGRMLTKRERGDNEMGQSSNQYELRKNVEDYLTKKVQSMLDKVLGDNNSIVRISTELTFDKITRTSEQVDPDNSAILSEERNEESSANTDTTHFKRENTITNYELNKVIEQFSGSVGDVKQLSVAVFVNGIYKSPEEPNVARTDEEMEKITDIVKNAVGYSADRNDQVEVQQLGFDRSLLEKENDAIAALEKEEKFLKYGKIVVWVIALLLSLIGLKSLVKKLGLDEYLRQQRELLLQETADSMANLIEEKEPSEEERRQRLIAEAKDRQQYQEKIKREVTIFANDHQKRTSHILRFWLVEDSEE